MGLLVKTYLAESTIPGAGVGCFAAEFIPQGEKIWELDTSLDRVYSQKEYEQMNEANKNFLNTYAYKYNGLYILCVDNGRFFNHSQTDFNTHDPKNEHCTYANRDIKAGEEILSNYKSFGSSDEDEEFNTFGL
jgi:SET domain-containing protein